MAITVYRKGVTASEWTSRQKAVLANKPETGEVVALVIMNSKGGGNMEIWTHIDSDSFAEVAAHMVAANREAAIRAFGNALLVAPAKD